MINLDMLTPGTFIEDKNGIVYKIMYKTKTTVTIKNISTDVVEMSPISSIRATDYTFVDVKGNYIM